MDACASKLLRRALWLTAIGCNKYAMDKGEPPSTPRAKSLFRIGKNSRGNWVVQDQSGLCGGLFVDRAEAVKFAMLENGNRPQAVIMVPGVLELDMHSSTRNHWNRNEKKIA